jgi:hypothetical protein
VKAEQKFTAHGIYALAFGLFLGLCIWKFGNPVILDQKISAPHSLSDFLNEPWPTHWAKWILIPLLAIGVVLLLKNKVRWPETKWLLILPLVWFGWQLVSATHTVDKSLTATTLWQFAGCLACYFVGASVIGRERGWQLVMVGLLAAFAFCLVRAVNQKLFEFPSDRQFLLENQKTSWTNLPPEVFQEMKREGVIVQTNGMDMANPAIIARYEKGRVFGTLVYPNALAGIVLLLLPLAILMVLQSTQRLRRLTRAAAIGLTIFLGGAGLFWSGSKSGWLIALAVGVFWLCRLKWTRRLKWSLALVVLAGGLTVFGLRFQSYFAKGASSVGARFDYWQVAARVAKERPLLGSGPGTFQCPYAELKRPKSEMARLTHNDYLEQFSDSGWIGGLSYLVWIGLLLWTTGRRVRQSKQWLEFAVFAGVLGWFTQGLIEFSLYIPALAWTAFTLGGCLLGRTANQFDKTQDAR